MDNKNLMFFNRPCAHHHVPESLHTLNPKLQSLNLEASSLNPKPLNPKPYLILSYPNPETQSSRRLKQKKASKSPNSNREAQFKAASRGGGGPFQGCPMSGVLGYMRHCSS